MKWKITKNLDERDCIKRMYTPYGYVSFDITLITEDVNIANHFRNNGSHTGGVPMYTVEELPEED